MGCTSSTVNIPESQSSTTDNMENNMRREESDHLINRNDIIYSNSKELEPKIQVLPECDILNIQMRVASDDSTKSTGDSLDVENKGVQDSTPLENNADIVPVTQASPVLDNFVSLKIVVEKAISKNTDEDEQISNVIEMGDVDLDRQIDEIIMESNDSEGVEVELNEVEAKESPSPTQSEDSRATRWEALADIAAELPPSLAVDPLTGQIYSLTK